MTDSFEFLSNVPVNQQIYRTLRQDIVTCAIAPGAFLSEKEISTRFNVSRQPVREAFIKLAEAGLVQVLPQRGTYVMKISSKRVADGRFIREAVETAVVRRAAMVATDKDLALLGHNLERQTLAAKRQQTQEFLLLDDEFHRTIAQIIDCRLAWETVEHIKATMDRVRFLTLSKVSPPENLIAQHYAIFDGLQAHDPDAAEKAIRIHLQEMISTITPIAEQNSDWFDAE
ncbi:GntR family transcriptional regulator [Rahnella sp. C60]|uniref:GntR family transcriptional regulator n=1 Tax=Rahnella perminowiae TaxID=2816244 RepID=A0ABS6L4F2_9GAMM|nr:MULTISPECIES: GntR family transcriptional regulator [Rahnella]UJD88299.1 GntR family transcriptional regulator [Rahnella aquatilis]MBU9808779.1 GntR family transcriptional regulator [Rahnella perminowiae]MBU9816407.1 GntR family transcriptional regulator [Rahnella perminowiae]MBU9826320.1 GntR family transcriptional regulator [Rahnella perminowiae]MBU9836752.1 GntR family transcriptional regulator [Rahnella perminowiae]